MNTNMLEVDQFWKDRLFKLRQPNQDQMLGWIAPTPISTTSQTIATNSLSQTTTTATTNSDSTGTQYNSSEKSKDAITFPSDKCELSYNSNVESKFLFGTSYLNSLNSPKFSSKQDNQNAVVLSREEALVTLSEKTSYPILQENGQRRYGPPPDWQGPQPPRGCEVFIGKIPRDCFEDELVPIFEMVGKIYMFRLMMDFSGCNRGYGFCIYTNREDTRRAVAELDSYEIRKGKLLGVCFSVDNCRLFVGGIPKSKTKDEIMVEMLKVTEGVKDVIVYPSIADKTKNRGFAFVEYENHKAAAMARRKLIPGRIHLWGHQIAVDWAEPEREVDENIMSKVRILYVRNLMLHTTEDVVKDYFNRSIGALDAVERVKKIRDYAFVHFRDRMQAIAALRQLDGTILDGSKIEVTWAKPVDKNDNLRNCRNANPNVKISPFSSYLGSLIPAGSTTLLDPKPIPLNLMGLGSSDTSMQVSLGTNCLSNSFQSIPAQLSSQLTALKMSPLNQNTNLPAQTCIGLDSSNFISNGWNNVALLQSPLSTSNPDSSIFSNLRLIGGQQSLINEALKLNQHPYSIHQQRNQQNHLKYQSNLKHQQQQQSQHTHNTNFICNQKQQHLHQRENQQHKEEQQSRPTIETSAGMHMRKLLDNFTSEVGNENVNVNIVKGQNFTNLNFSTNDSDKEFVNAYLCQFKGGDELPEIKRNENERKGKNASSNPLKLLIDICMENGIGLPRLETQALEINEPNAGRKTVFIGQLFFPALNRYFCSSTPYGELDEANKAVADVALNWIMNNCNDLEFSSTNVSNYLTTNKNTSTSTTNSVIDSKFSSAPETNLSEQTESISEKIMSDSHRSRNSSTILPTSSCLLEYTSFLSNKSQLLHANGDDEMTSSIDLNRLSTFHNDQGLLSEEKVIMHHIPTLVPKSNVKFQYAKPDELKNNPQFIHMESPNNPPLQCQADSCNSKQTLLMSCKYPLEKYNQTMTNNKCGLQNELNHVTFLESNVRQNQGYSENSLVWSSKFNHLLKHSMNSHGEISNKLNDSNCVYQPGITNAYYGPSVTLPNQISSKNICMSHDVVLENLNFADNVNNLTKSSSLPTPNFSSMSPQSIQTPMFTSPHEDTILAATTLAESPLLHETSIISPLSNTAITKPPNRND